MEVDRCDSLSAAFVMFVLRVHILKIKKTNRSESQLQHLTLQVDFHKSPDKSPLVSLSVKWYVHNLNLECKMALPLWKTV